MTVKVRRILFITLTVLFVVAGTGLVLYSRGARFDFKNWDIIQTGGIYLKTEPPEALIEMDGKSVENRSGLLQSGTLISNLRSGSYKVVISRENYYPWEKEIEVASSTVSVFDGIILFPKQKAELIASPTDKFLLELKGETMSDSELAELSSLFNQLKERQLRLPGPVPIKKVLPYPYNDRKFIVLTDRALYALDTEKRVISRISPRARDFTFAGNEVFWFEDRGFFSFNLILRNQSQINLPPELKIAEFDEIQVSSSGEIVAILKKNNELIIWNRSTDKVTSFGHGITHFIFSPDSKKIVFSRQSGSLSVYGIKDGALKEKFILEDVNSGWSGMEEIAWHEDNNYLFLKDEGHKLYFVEVNDSPPINVVEVAVQVKNFIYNKDDDSLYFEDNQGIWRIKL